MATAWQSIDIKLPVHAGRPTGFGPVELQEAGPQGACVVVIFASERGEGHAGSPTPDAAGKQC